MLESTFRAIVSGEQRGPLAALARGVLGCVEWPYTAVVEQRNRRFDNDPLAVHQAGVPVISVGNLTLGGTGKTPMVKWLARELADDGKRVVLISRGYRGAGGEQNDEAVELAQSLPGIAHVQNPDRVAAAATALAEHGAEVLLLDDAFQHRRIARDLDIVLLDATAPFGYGHVFPRGLLREPAAGLRRADVVCLTRADLIDERSREAICQQAHRLAPEALWCEATHAPAALLSNRGEQQPLAVLAGKRVAAFCGIGNPDAFRATLAGTGCEIVAWRALSDHHHYTAEDRQTIAKLADAAKAELVVCTHKDLVKVATEEIDGRPLFAIVIEMQFKAGEHALRQWVSKAGG